MGQKATSDPPLNPTEDLKCPLNHRARNNGDPNNRITSDSLELGRILEEVFTPVAYGKMDRCDVVY